jgi:hypothetical protein
MHTRKRGTMGRGHLMSPLEEFKSLGHKNTKIEDPLRSRFSHNPKKCPLKRICKRLCIYVNSLNN